MKTFIVLVYLKYKMHLTNFHFYNSKNYLYSKPVKGLRGYEVGYGFSFNGKEKDNEGMGGGGSTYDYGFRIYNAQLGRFLSIDPLFQSYPFYTPFQFAGNKPVWMFDIDGMEGGIGNMIPPQAWAFDGIRQPYNQQEAEEWWNSFLMMYGEAYVSVMLFALPVEDLVLVGVVKAFGYSRPVLRMAEFKQLRELLEVKVSLKGRNSIESVGKKEVVNGLSGAYNKVENFLEAIYKGDLTKLGQLKGSLFEIKAAEKLEGTTAINSWQKLSEGKGSWEIDIIRKTKEGTFFGQVKSGDFTKRSFKDFFKKNRTQIEATLDAAKNNAAKPEFIFNEGSVSVDIRRGLEGLGFKVT